MNIINEGTQLRMLLWVGQQVLILIILSVTVIRLYMIQYQILQKNIQRILASICGCIVVGLYTALLSNFLSGQTVLFRMLRYINMAEQFIVSSLCLSAVFFVGTLHLDEKLKRYGKILLGVVGFFVLFILTNDLHQQVFKISFDGVGRTLFNCNWGYLVIMVMTGIFCAIASVVFAVILLRSKENKGKFLLIIYLIVASVNCIIYFYINSEFFFGQNFITWKNDRGITLNILILLFVHVMITSDLIPVNSYYYDLFENSNLKLLITDHDLHIVFKSKGIVDVAREELEAIVMQMPEPYMRNEKQLIHAAKLPNGFAFYAQDITSLTAIQKETEQTLQSLKKLNEMLAKENHLKRTEARDKISTQLMTGLEGVITDKTNKLLDMIAELYDMEEAEEGRNYWLQLARITLSLVHIKRHCILYFVGRQAPMMAAEELYVYLDELAEFAGYANLRCITTHNLRGEIPVNYAAFAYNFFYILIEQAIKYDNSILIEEIQEKGNQFEMHIMTSFRVDNMDFLKGDTIETVSNYGGEITCKELEDVFDFCLQIPLRRNL